MIDFSDAQIERYARHLVLPEIGDEGQAKLLDSSVLVIGAGGLGSPLLLYLAAAGVGRIGVIRAWPRSTRRSRSRPTRSA